MGAGDYTVDITLDLERVETGDAHRTFNVNAQWLDSGDWQASWPLTHEGARTMLRSVAVDGVDPARWGMAVRPRGSATAAVGGWCTQVGVIEGSVAGYSSDAIVAWGHTDLAVLASRLCLPDASVDAPTGTRGTWSVIGPGPWASGEAAIVDLLATNLGATAITRRRITSITIPSSAGAGTAYDADVRLPSLLDVIRDICVATGLTMRIDRVGGALVVVIGPQVRNDDVSFSRGAGTAAGVALMWSAATATTAIVGGSGEGTARKFTRESATAPPGGWAWDREVFVDGGDERLANLQASGRKALAERAGGAKVKVQTAATTPWHLGSHYQLGDKVGLSAGKTALGSQATVEARAEAWSLKHDRTGWVEELTIGQPLDDPDAVTRRLLADVRRRTRI